MEIQNDVEKEDNVDDRVDNEQWHVVHGLWFEGDIVWHEYWSVESEKKDEAVPEAFECTVVENYVWWCLWRFLAILR